MPSSPARAARDGSAPSHGRRPRTAPVPNRLAGKESRTVDTPSSCRRPGRTASSGRRAIRCRSGRRRGRADICYIRRRSGAKLGLGSGTASATIADVAADPLAQLVAGAGHVQVVGDQPDRADAAGARPSAPPRRRWSGCRTTPARARRSRRTAADRPDRPRPARSGGRCASTPEISIRRAMPRSTRSKPRSSRPLPPVSTTIASVRSSPAGLGSITANAA